jgi:hypothetical protein
MWVPPKAPNDGPFRKQNKSCHDPNLGGVITPNAKSVLSENLGGILGGT